MQNRPVSRVPNELLRKTDKRRKKMPFMTPLWKFHYLLLHITACCMFGNDICAKMIEVLSAEKSDWFSFT